MTQFQSGCGNLQMASRLPVESLYYLLLTALCATAASVFAAESPSKPEVLTLQPFDDATAIPLRPNIDGGNPPAVEASSEQSHAGKTCVKITYKNAVSGYGNLQMPFTLCGAEDSIGIWVRKISAAKGAALHLWLFQESGDAWLSPTTKLDELADGWQRVEVKLKDFIFQKRGDGAANVTETSRLLIGCNFADFTICINDLFVTGSDIAARRKAPKPVALATVEVDPNAIACKKFLGFGAEWDPQFWTNGSIGPVGDTAPPLVTEDDWATMLKRIRFMKLPIVRMMMMARWCTEDGNKFDFETKRMQSMYRHLDVCEKEGIAVILTDWGCYNWTKIPAIAGNHDPKQAAAIGTYLDHFLNKKKYTCIKYFVLENEPNCDRDTNWDSWKTGVENMHKELVARKFADKITFIGSDQSGGDDWHYRSVDQLHDIFGGYDVHEYPELSLVKSLELQKYIGKMWEYSRGKDPKGKDKPLIVCEAGIISPGWSAAINPRHEQFEYGIDMADYALQAAQVGSSAVSTWMLDDNCINGFTWGMCRDKAHGMGVKPWFYPWSLLCRTVRPGATIYRISGLPKQVRAIAARLVADGGWSFVIINRNAGIVSAKLHAAEGGKVSMWRYDYTSQAAPADADGLPKSVGDVQGALDAGIEVAVPGNSVVFLTTVSP